MSLTISRNIMRAVTDTIFDGDEAKVEPITKLIRVIEAKTEERH